MAEADGRQFEISSVISRSFETISGNFLLFVGLSLIFAGVPAIATEWWQLTNVTVVTDPGQVFAFSNLMPVFAGWLVGMVSGAVLQAALTRATVTYLSGETPGFGQCLAAGLTMILPLIGIGILVTLGVGLATLLLIIPGIILWLCWSVVVPAYVQEKIGVFAAFGRSVELTRGYRWRIFLTFLALVVGLWLLSIPVAMLTVAVGAAVDSPIAVAVLSGALGALGNMVMVTIQASIYVELRDVKEGVAPGDLEAIFA